MSRPSARASAAQATIAATSRKPRFSPCAPIGGRTCAGRRRAPAVSDDLRNSLAHHREEAALPSMRMAPRSECAWRRSPRKGFSVERPTPFGFVSRHYPDKASSGWALSRWPATATEGEWAAAGVELGREVVHAAVDGEMRRQMRFVDSDAGAPRGPQRVEPSSRGRRRR